MANFGMGYTFIVLFAFLAGTNAVVDYRNETIACVFREIQTCYQSIAALGANFSAIYAETPREVNSTCKAQAYVNECLHNVAPTCNAMYGVLAQSNVTNFLGRLCTNKSQEQMSFLNSSVCYNRNNLARKDCIKEFSYNYKTDAKSLCCSNKKTQACLHSHMNMCGKNATSFHSTLMASYWSYHAFICTPYMKYCNSSPGHFASLVTVLITVVTAFQHKFR